MDTVWVSKIVKSKVGMPIFVMLIGIFMGCCITFATMKSTKTIALAFTITICFPFVLAIYNNIKHILLAGLILCLPVTVDKTLNFAEHTGGAAGYIISAFDILLIGLYAIWFFEVLLKREGRFRFHTSISLPGIGIIVAAFLSIINARHSNFSIYETIEIIKMFLAFFYIANNIRNQREINIIIAMLLFGLFLEGTVGIIQRRYSIELWPTSLGGPHFIRNDRVSGTWVSTNDYSWCMTFLLPIGISFLFSKIHVFKKYLLFLLIGLGMLGLVYSKSRAGMLALPISILFVSIISIGKIRDKTNLFNLFFAVIAIAFFSSPIYPKAWHSISYRFLNDDGGSAESRLPQFAVAWKIIKKNPVVGIGINNYSEIMWEFDTASSAESLDEITRQPVHNIFLCITAEMGLIGFAAFIWFITSIFNQGFSCIRKNDHPHHFFVIGLLGGILAFLAHGLVDAATIGNKLYLFIWVFAGIIIAIQNITYEQKANISIVEHRSLIAGTQH